MTACPAASLSEEFAHPAGSEGCDKRDDTTLAQQHFPAVDFSLIENAQDIVWQQYRPESEAAVQDRGKRFLQWLMARYAVGHA